MDGSDPRSDDEEDVFDALGRGPVPPRAALRDHVLELAGAPTPPIDPQRYEWTELRPGVRIHVLREDPLRGVRRVLVWALPGATLPLHRHVGDEAILVLQGALRDERGTYLPGQVCSSIGGSSHTEEALPGEDCFCYVVSFGGIEVL